MAENPNKEEISIFWFRRDLRIEDNQGLFRALNSGISILPIFIFDTIILDKLFNKTDARVHFIHNSLVDLNRTLREYGSSLWVFHESPKNVYAEILTKFKIVSVYTNHDYEPYARKRDQEIGEFLNSQGIELLSFKDQVLFEKDEVVKEDGKPYSVFTPYKRRWLDKMNQNGIPQYLIRPILKNKVGKWQQNINHPFPSLEEIGFRDSKIEFPGKEFNSALAGYSQNRDYPYKNGTSRISVHLRFGTLSIREIIKIAIKASDVWLSELIWREFYFSILWHFPYVVEKSFKPQYDRIQWRNSPEDFEKWSKGQTGYPIVDAGMRELNSTGFMHNRVRMIVASFLTKHLLIDWRWGEAYFAEKLLDFELSSNNGGWQWCAGTGVDASPYFRIFNPYEQEKKFDPNHVYIEKWIPEWNTEVYPKPMVDHKFARTRCLETYKTALQ